MSDAKQQDEARTTGVQDLIDRLKEEGVSEGREQGEQLVAEARREAARLLEEARREADALLAKARAEADAFRESGREDVRLACRDAVLGLQAQVYEGLRDRLRVLVGHTLSDRGFLERLVLEIAGRSVPKEGRVEVLLPPHVKTEEELQDHPEDREGETLTRLVLDVTADAMRDGVTLSTGDEPGGDVRVRLLDEDVEVDLSDEAVARLLQRHLRPRFRAVVRGGGDDVAGA